MTVCSAQDSNPIQVFYSKNATNHPGGQSGSPNWFHYWTQAYGVAAVCTYQAGYGFVAEVKGMTEWSYSTPSDKTTRFMCDPSADIAGYVGTPSFGPWTGINAYYSTYLHESNHVSQISRADAVVGTASGTCWQHGWSWNVSNDNHWSVGSDTQPGQAGVNDDGIGGIDNQITSGPGEMGALGSDDVQLDVYGYDWPNAWGTPPAWPGPWGGGDPIEHESFLAMGISNYAYWTWDWGKPGKQHKINGVHDN